MTLNARTRKRYLVLRESPVLLKLLTFGPTWAISTKLVQPEPWQRSILKPLSLFELSVHARLI